MLQQPEQPRYPSPRWDTAQRLQAREGPGCWSDYGRLATDTQWTTRRKEAWKGLWWPPPATGSCLSPFYTWPTGQACHLCPGDSDLGKILLQGRRAHRFPASSRLCALVRAHPVLGPCTLQLHLLSSLWASLIPHPDHRAPGSLHPTSLCAPQSAAPGLLCLPSHFLRSRVAFEGDSFWSRAEPGPHADQMWQGALQAPAEASVQRDAALSSWWGPSVWTTPLSRLAPRQCDPEPPRVETVLSSAPSWLEPAEAESPAGGLPHEGRGMLNPWKTRGSVPNQEQPPGRAGRSPGEPGQRSWGEALESQTWDSKVCNSRLSDYGILAWSRVDGEGTREGDLGSFSPLGCERCGCRPAARVCGPAKHRLCQCDILKRRGL